MMAKSVSLRNIVLERNEVMFLLNSRLFCLWFYLMFDRFFALFVHCVNIVDVCEVNCIATRNSSQFLNHEAARSIVFPNPPWDVSVLEVNSPPKYLVKLPW